MTIQTQCRTCGRKYRLSDAMGGKRARCKECGQPMDIPAAVGVAAAPAPAPGPGPGAPGSPAPAGSAPKARSAAAPAARAAVTAKARSASPARTRPPAAQAPAAAPALTELEKLEQQVGTPALRSFEPAPSPRPAPRPAAARRGNGAPGLPGARPWSDDAPAKERKFAGPALVIWGVVLVLVLAGLVTLISPAAGKIVGPLYLLVGFGAVITAGIWMLVLAASDGAVTVILCLVIPFYSLYFILSNLDRTGKPLLLNIGGTVLIMIGFFLGAAGVVAGH